MQFLTGDSAYSNPTRALWQPRLGTAWPRLHPPGHALYGLGNWRDASNVNDGPAPYGSSAALTAVNQVASVLVTALVQKWITSGQNRGFYLIPSSATSPWPIRFYGRGNVTPANRPTLTVVTDSGTFTLYAAANSCWNNTSFSAGDSKNRWALYAGIGPGIVRFDLSTFAGTVTNATLTFKVESFPDGGSVGQVINVFEADPPTLVVPEDVSSAVLGLAAQYPTFNALKNSGALIFADDFETPSIFDGGFRPAATKAVNSASGTTYARGEITVGTHLSLDARKDVSVGSRVRGTPDVVIPELFGQYWMYLESDFGTAVDSIKIPAMGVQFGYWNPVGYWQQTTGNGGYQGTGLKVDNGGTTNFEYQGHSVRMLTGYDRPIGDEDPYPGWFGIALYPYNLDQGGSFPPGENFPNIVIRRDNWYCFDIRVKQNTMSGAQDGLGNYAIANPDGIYQVWINGLLAYSKTSFRWRRHAEMGVQGMWLDIYHGGQNVAPSTMHYRIDRVSLASSYIGPKP